VSRALTSLTRPFLTLAAASVLVTGAVAQEAESPGTGTLLATIDGNEFSLPITSMDVELYVTGPIVRAYLRQTFTNPTHEVLDAAYVFPLPEGSAVDGLELQVGDRSYSGKIQEKEEARRTYEAAKTARKGAGLVEQHRPNLFRTSVANIPPGASVVVAVSLLDEADWRDGAFSTVFPTTITARYAPPGLAEARVAATPQAPSVLIAAWIDAGIPVSSVRSASHAITTQEHGRAVTVTVGEGPVAADRDFVLTWRPQAGTGPAAGGLVEEREDGLYGLAIVVPPGLDRHRAALLPTQTVFVVDVSGSMSGPSIEQARAALLVALDGLRPGDAFTLIKFDSENEAYSERFLPVTAGEIDAAKRWVSSLETGSGTEILPALVRALDLSERGDASLVRRVVLITDGAVENEDEVLAEVERRLGDSRLHIVGIGAAPNRWLMKELARVGRGAFESIAAPGEIRPRIVGLLARTGQAAVTDVTLEWEGAPPLDANPDPVPDLYAGEPLVVTARFDPGKPLPRLRVWGRAPGGPVTMDVAFRDAAVNSGIGTRWARAEIARAEQALLHGADPKVVRADVVDLATRFSLVTRYTSFVVVEDDDYASDECCCGDDAVDAELPQGGTFDPLLLAIGVLLTASGAFYLRRAVS
jgi:Ca-activated chloride channel family protein